MLISVIVPVYNAEPFLVRCVKSITSQTVPDLEILLVDDGSQDGSLALCRQLAEKDGRIRVFHKENGGAASARNLGVREAKGAWLGFVDSDDYIEPSMYATLAEAAERTGDGSGPLLFQIGRDEVSEDGTRLPDVLPVTAETRTVSPEQFMESLLLYTGDSSFCTKLVPRSLLLAHPFPEGAAGEDFLLHMQLLPDTAGVVILPETGYHVVHREGSVTRKKAGTEFARSYSDVIRHADYVEQNVVLRYPALAVQAERFGLYVRLDYMLHVPIADMNQNNVFYQEVLSYLRQHFRAMRANPYLTGKDKRYLTLLTRCPKAVRKIHYKLKMKRQAGQVENAR